MVTIDQKIAELLEGFNVDGWPVGNLILCVIALILSVVLCGAIGIEEKKRKKCWFKNPPLSRSWFMYHHDYLNCTKASYV